MPFLRSKMVVFTAGAQEEILASAIFVFSALCTGRLRLMVSGNPSYP